jgi:hypothetical protein
LDILLVPSPTKKGPAAAAREIRELEATADKMAALNVLGEAVGCFVTHVPLERINSPIGGIDSSAIALTNP